MIRITTYILLAFLSIGTIFGQTNFEKNIKKLAFKLDSVTVSNRAALKNEIRIIEKQYDNDRITYEEATEQKEKATVLYATIIKKEVGKIEAESHDLIQQKVDAKIFKETDKDPDSFEIMVNKFPILRLVGNKERKAKRTYSNFVFAFGFNNLIKNDINSIQDSNFKFASHFIEWGVNYKTRIFKNSSVAYLDYGLSLSYNKLMPKDNQYFITDESETLLVEHFEDLKKATLINKQLVIPVFLEFDFSKSKMRKNKKIYRRFRTFRFGVGAFGGINVNTKQKIKYEKNDKKFKNKTKGDFNVNKFVYGLNAFIGYKETSFYVKYDMQDLFKDSFENQKNFSFGIRFDL